MKCTYNVYSTCSSQDRKNFFLVVSKPKKENFCYKMETEFTWI